MLSLKSGDLNIPNVPCGEVDLGGQTKYLFADFLARWKMNCDFESSLVLHDDVLEGTFLF